MLAFVAEAVKEWISAVGAKSIAPLRRCSCQPSPHGRLRNRNQLRRPCSSWHQEQPSIKHSMRTTKRGPVSMSIGTAVNAPAAEVTCETLADRYARCGAPPYRRPGYGQARALSWQQFGPAYGELETRTCASEIAGIERWPGESGQWVEWIFCLRAAQIAADQERA